jgi:2',3'-cyclic-nucleotide 2'-phosphodiesterase (5'-nucleotidase family)
MRPRLFLHGILFLLLSVSCSHKPRVVKTELSHQFLATAGVDSSTYKILNPYKEKLDREMNEVVSVSEEALTKDQPEGTLGNFVSDCLLNFAKEKAAEGAAAPDMVFLNNGGLRVSLPQGDITKGKIFELMPFDNELVGLKLTGSELSQLLRFIAEKGGMPVAGLRMEINPKKKPVNVKINGAALDTLRTYYVITSDYLAEGGDNLAFLKPVEKVYLKVAIRDALLDYCRKLKKQNTIISVKTDGRISFSK